MSKNKTRIDWPFDYATCLNSQCSKASKCARHKTNHKRKPAIGDSMFSPTEDKCNSYVDLRAYVSGV